MQTLRTPRVQITLRPETRAIFARLAQAQERPEATIISEFLDETAPALSNVISVVERAKNVIAKVGEKERERYAVAEAQLLQHTHTALSALAGTDAVFGQLGLDLGRATVAEKAGLPRRARSPSADPPDTNRGVNTKRRSNGKGSIS